MQERKSFRRKNCSYYRYLYLLFEIISLRFYKLQKLRLFIMAFKSSYVTLSYLQYQELRYFKNIA